MKSRKNTHVSFYHGVAACLAFALAVIFFTGFHKTQVAESGTGENLSGYAWSDTIGWISMNCTNPATCGAHNYGVTVARDGALSGHAWSEHIGWISFNAADVAGCPNGSCAPRLNRSTGVIEGWAKALGGGTANSGGWDGFISLSGANYRVRVDQCDWSGYAWGSGVVGWVQFGGHAGDVIGTGDACMTNAVLNAPDCTIPPGQSTCTTDLTWSSNNAGTPNVKQGTTVISTAVDQGVPGHEVPISNGTHTFTLYDGATPLASDNATAACASGSTWDTTLVPPACSGTTPGAPALTFDAIPDDIPVGGSTELQWTITVHPADACWARNNKGNPAWDGWKNKDMGSTHKETLTLTETTTFFLECFNQGVSSGEKSKTVTVDTADTTNATINPDNCTIAEGESNCNTLVRWTSLGVTNPSIRQGTGPLPLPVGAQFSTNAQSPTGGQVRPMGHGTHNFCIYEGAAQVRCEAATAACAGGAALVGGVCPTSVPPPVTGSPTLRANPRVVVEGEDTRLTWFTGGVPETNCRLTGGAFGTAGIAVPSDTFNLAADRGSIDTPVTGNTVYEITCPTVATASVIVEIIPRGFET